MLLLSALLATSAGCLKDEPGAAGLNLDYVVNGGEDTPSRVPIDIYIPPPDVPEVGPTLCEVARGFGCACEDHDQCDSGWCIDTDEGRICTEPCVDSCPGGFACVNVAGLLGSDVAWLCMPRSAKLCQPCHASTDCQSKGDPGLAVCLDYGDSGRFCGVGCANDAQCPAGYECAEATLPDGSTEKQCLKTDGVCECNWLGGKLGMTTGCAASNDLGVCAGERGCGAEGLTACDALEPAEEICDGLDNDCNGIDDDLAETAVCHNVNEHGSCPGEPACLEGGKEVCLADTPGPEVCDGLDNNCDAVSDEGYENTDGDALADCVDGDDDDDGLTDENDNCPKVANPDQADADLDGKGDPCDSDQDGDGYANAVDCGPEDPAINPGASEVCDGADNDCDEQVDEDTCIDAITCSFDSCNAATGECEHLPDDSACEDGNPCTVNQCNTQTGCLTAQGTGAPCDDGNSCTFGDTCSVGQCKGTPAAGCCLTAADCDDNNGCTADSCDPGTGLCKNDSGVMNGLGCNADGNGCTTGDSCAFGTCLPGAPVQCAAAGSACEVSICQSTSSDTHLCKQVPSPPGKLCDDGNPCTSVDLCGAGGVCKPGNPIPDCCVVNADCDDENACSFDQCNTDTGKCSHQALPDGFVCDYDGNGCTQTDSCVQGQCVPGAPLVCPESPNACYSSKCASLTPSSAECVVIPGPSGVPCDDGKPCTGGDACDGAGSCLGGPVPVPGCCTAAEDCDDGNPCTVDGCEAGTGVCKSVPVADTTVCDDGNGCTTSDWCLAGKCTAGVIVYCPPPGAPCLQTQCVSVSADTHGCEVTPAPPNTQCTDGDICTVGDLCNGQGACLGTAMPGCCKTAADCGDGDPCSQDVCNAFTGVCTNPPAPAETPCDADGDGCTVGDACVGGVCAAGPAAQCEAETACTDMACTSIGPVGFVCEPTGDSTDGQPCDDDDECTTGDACQSFACFGGAALQCGDGNPCTANGCDPAIGCTTAPLANGSQCTDKSACTLNDQCVAGKCTGDGLDCEDNNPCTADACSPVSGCLHELQLGPCAGGAGKCVFGECCISDCSGKQCGIDGCGGQCGTCVPGETCIDPPAKCFSTLTDAMITIGGGTFQMGCNAAIDSECAADESPSHAVELYPYNIDITEVTVGKYAECVDAGSCSVTTVGGYCQWGKSGVDEEPINCVTWDQADTYCAWAGKRLCTEAEWEHAARGDDARRYPWGNENASCAYAIMKQGLNYGCGLNGPAPVASILTGGSPYGVLDMAGNVSEWVADFYSGTYYANSPLKSPKGPAIAPNRVYRGGAFFQDAEGVRSGKRYFLPPGNAWNELGIRCCKDYGT